jgi:hypothetical protein
MLVNVRTLLAVALCFVVGGAWAQTADWTRVASNLDQLNLQVLDWASDYGKAAASDTAAFAVADLHFKRGPVVASGMKALLSTWTDTSETQKKSRYLAVSRYFAAHCDDWGSTAAWAWYECFAPPLDARYNALAADAGKPAIRLVPAPVLSDAQRQELVVRLQPAIAAFLTANSYPVVDTPITRFSFDAQGVLIDGRSPRDRTLLNKAFTYGGGLLALFGQGF